MDVTCSPDVCHLLKTIITCNALYFGLWVKSLYSSVLIKMNDGRKKIVFMGYIFMTNYYIYKGHIFIKFVSTCRSIFFSLVCLVQLLGFQSLFWWGLFLLVLEFVHQMVSGRDILLLAHFCWQNAEIENLKYCTLYLLEGLSVKL